MAERAAIVTGASSGIGYALAQMLLEEGFGVTAAARRPEKLADAVKELGAGGGEIEEVAGNMAHEDDIQEVVRRHRERFGRLDVLVNNAGHGSVGAIEEIDIVDLRTLMDTLFFGPFALTQAVLPHMRERRSGAIVQMSSAGGQTSPPGFGAYCSAKFALEAASEALATEVAPFGIRVLIVEPGAFRTEFGGGRMHRSRDSGLYTETAGQNRAFIDGIDGTQPGDPEKAAAAILRALDEPDAPLRLALGGDAVDAIRAKYDRLLADLDAWEHVSRGVGLLTIAS